MISLAQLEDMNESFISSILVIGIHLRKSVPRRITLNVELISYPKTVHILKYRLRARTPFTQNTVFAYAKTLKLNFKVRLELY